MSCHHIGSSCVLRALFVRALFLAFLLALYTLGAPPDTTVVGHWIGRSPDPVGRTEEVELRFTTGDTGLTGVLHVADGDIPLQKIHFTGRDMTFDATRELRGRKILYHYDGTLSGDTLDFTVQNDDGSSFFRFIAHRSQ